MAVKKSTTSAAKKLENQKTTVSKGTTSIGSRPYSSPNTTTKAVKNTTTTTTTTAPKSSTTTTGARPYSSPNASTANQGTTAVNKGSNYTSLPYTTPNASAYNPAYTAPSAPVSNPISELASSLSNAANNAAPYASVVGLASGSVNPAPDTSNITPSSNTSDGSLWDAVVKSQGIAGSAATQPTSNILGNTTASHLDVTRPYSNPNYDYDEKYGSESNSISEGEKEMLDAIQTILHGPESEKAAPEVPYGLGKANLSTDAATRDLLDALSGEKADGDIRPYSTPNSDYYTTGGNGYPGSGADASASASASGGGNGGGGTRASGIGYEFGDNGYADVSALYDLLNQRLGEYDNNYESLLASLMDQYNLNYANLDDAYRAALEMLGRNYNNTEALLSGQLANSRNDLEEQRRRALQEAYISRMMQEKNLENVLAGYGLSGGATESVLANMLTNYANNRNNVETKMSSLLNDLLLNYATNISNARQRYNEGIMAAEQNRLSGRQSLANNLLSAQNNAANYRAQQRAGAEEDLFNALAKLTLNGYTY